jgi:hypothetical protein
LFFVFFLFLPAGRQLHRVAVLGYVRDSRVVLSPPDKHTANLSFSGNDRVVCIAMSNSAPSSHAADATASAAKAHARADIAATSIH